MFSAECCVIIKYRIVLDLNFKAVCVLVYENYSFAVDMSHY